MNGFGEEIAKTMVTGFIICIIVSMCFGAGLFWLIPKIFSHIHLSFN